VLVEAQGPSETEEHQEKIATKSRLSKQVAHQIRLRETRLARRTRLLTRILWWEPALGVAVLVCVGLMNVFAGTLLPITTTTQPAQSASGSAQALHTSVRTSDGLFTITLQISPGQVGSNAFLATVQEVATGKNVTNIGVSLYLTDLDMDMGTQTLNLQPDGKGHFSGLGDFLMGGNYGGHWQIEVMVRTLDNKLHRGYAKILVP